MQSYLVQPIKFLNVNITAEKKKNIEQYSESPKIFGTC